MTMNRREFLKTLQIASLAGLAPGAVFAGVDPKRDLYEAPLEGNVRLLHITDTHAQLQPVYFREPNVNIGVGASAGHPPHLVGRHFLDHFGLDLGTRKAHAFTYLDYANAASRYGKLGGFAYIKTLVDSLRDQAGRDSTLLLDGGDLLQGSATSYWTRGQDMVGAGNRMGFDFTTGHWEFTYKEEEIRANIDAFDGEFLAQNVFLSEDALFEGAQAYDEASGRVFKPYSVREVGGKRVAIVGQAFPYTPIANPSYFIPDWRFGIRETELQNLVNAIRQSQKVDAVVLLSHNGMDVDLKLASRVTGIDAILGGHTHDAVPAPTIVKNSAGKTIVANGGSNGKFVGVLDLDIGNGGVRDYRYRLLPVFSNMIKPDPDMASYIDQVREPYTDRLTEKLAVADDVLYRRGNFNGTMDQVICDAMRSVLGADIAFSPGFRWGTTLVPGQTITMEDVMNETAITYPETYVNEMTGQQIKAIMEDVCDNLFNTDPYYQQGGDMVRIGGMDYVCNPKQTMNQRISDLTLDNGTPLDPNKTYKVAGWATVNSKATGAPIWDVVAEYMRSEKNIQVKKLNTPKLKSMNGNLGIEDYG
jgi:sulfur-oxidizing protein SoxB